MSGRRGGPESEGARTGWTGADLIALGASEGPALGRMLRVVNARPHTAAEVGAVVEAHRPPPALAQRAEPAPCEWNITAETEDERENVARLRETMDVVLRVPVVERGAIMPDACPSGPVGTIPVGGVVAARDAILPGMHSADICCSLMATVLDGPTPAEAMAAAHEATHFGPGGRGARGELALPDALAEAVDALPYPGLGDVARAHMGTQGDGNHFAFVGTLESTGQTALVTHHGSRGLGARVFRAGMRIAEDFRKRLSPTTPKQNAWIPWDTDEGRAYWAALGTVREWTRRNHESLHELVVGATGAAVALRRWNEHNFVFREDDDDGALFWHAKGATPIHDPLLPDTDGVQIVPLNMAEPVLFVVGERNARNLGFAPHGAGRNTSRTRHKRRLAGRSEAEVLAEETAGLDVRFFCGRADVSELPSAYKDAASVQADMARFELARVVDRVLPHGSIMAGDWERDAPWKVRARERAARREGAGAPDAPDAHRPDGHEENARWPS